MFFKVSSVFDGYAMGYKVFVIQSEFDIDVSFPLSMQRAVLVPALEGRDIIGRAKTGTGKTLAFAIPIIKRVTEEDEENRNRYLCNEIFTYSLL